MENTMPNVNSPLEASLQRQIEQLVDAEGLPGSFVNTVTGVYQPLAAQLALRYGRKGETLLVAVNGAQGTGKSTLAAFLRLLLAGIYHLPTVGFSLDDIYLTKSERQRLGQQVHPLLAVRGVPGSHDVGLGINLIEQLASATPGQTTAIPAFDKRIDDRKPEHLWPVFSGKPAVIILEGWCMGAVAENPRRLSVPINDLEKNCDANGLWRRYVNQQLQDIYPALFARFDVLIMIAAPSWEKVYQWRLLQEEKLRQKCQRLGLAASAVMTPEQVAEFIQHYERVTRHCLQEMPARADYLLSLNNDHHLQLLTGLDIA